jgi:hypothetical protein
MYAVLSGVLRVMTAKPKEIGAVMCGSLDDHVTEDWFAKLVLGELGAKCPEIERRAAETICPGDVDCGGATCTQKQLHARHEKAIAAALATKPPRPPVPELHVDVTEAELAFRYAQGPVKLSADAKGCDAGNAK